MKLSNQFFEELRQFEDKFLLISGGYHSTSSALSLKDNGFEDVTLIHNETGLEMRSSIKTINKVIEKTNYEIIYVIPNLKQTIWELMKECFLKVPEIKKELRAGAKFDRGKFKCCYALKKKPIRNFYKQLNTKNSVIVSSLCPYESQNRGVWLSELRAKKTYLRPQYKYNGLNFIYPFRDHYKELDFVKYLTKKGFNKIERSACIICPIVLVWNRYNAKNYYSSLKA